MKANLKQFLALLCAGAMALSLAACTSSDPKPASSNASGSNTASVPNQTDGAYVSEGDFNIRVFAAAGGVADVITRLTAQSLQENYKMTPVINNLTGANGAVAAADMDTYDPSIHELSLVSMSLFTMAPLMNPDLNVKLDDYEVVGSLVRDNFVLLVSASSGIKSWDDLVAYGKDNKIIYASNTPGGNTHIVQTALFGDAGLDAEALTSDGSNKDILAVMSGDAIVTSATATLAASYVQSGDMIPILIFSDEVYTGFEGFEVPTAPSVGYDITLPSYNFLICRAGVPENEVKGFYDAIEACRQTDSFKEAAAAANYTPDSTDGATLRAEIEKYAKVCQEVHDKYYK